MAELVNSEVWSGPRKPAVEFHAGAKLAATSEEFAAFRDAAGAWRREASRRLDALKARAAKDDDAAALDRERAVDALGQCRAIKDVLRAVGLDLARGLDRAAARARNLEAGGGGAGLVAARAGKESEIPNFKGSYLGRFPLVSAGFWTSDHLLERSRSVDAFSRTRARGALTLKRR